MKLTHAFTVPLGQAETAKAFRDMELFAGCMPGASLDAVTPEGATGRVKVKVGPIAVTFRGELREVGDRDSQDLIHLVGEARELKGLGDSRVEIILEFTPQGSGTAIKTTTDLALSGRLAQFGGGVITELADQIFGQFVANLHQRLGLQSEGLAAETPGPSAGGDAINPLAIVPPSVRQKGPIVALGVVALLAFLRLLRPGTRGGGCCCTHVVLYPQSLTDISR